MFWRVTRAAIANWCRMANEHPVEPFKVLLNKLVKSPEYFTPTDLKNALNLLFSSTPAIHPAQIGAFLTALHINHIERRPESLAAAAEVLREHAIKVVLDDQEIFVVDIVGTGGDGYNTFNVSTTAAVVAAGAGARVVKVSNIRTTLGTPINEKQKER
jgi:anthranilate phosphoribosyltransferase